MNEYGLIVEPRVVRFERLLPGPIERVWSYLTDSEKRGTWLASGKMELRVGGRVELAFRNSELTGTPEPVPAKYAKYGGNVVQTGRVLVCEPPRRLAYTWGENAGKASEVTFELTPRGDGVLLVLTHRYLPTRDVIISVAGGWHTHLDILADRLEGRRPPGFWSTHARWEAEYDKRIPTD